MGYSIIGNTRTSLSHSQSKGHLIAGFPHQIFSSFVASSSIITAEMIRTVAVDHLSCLPRFFFSVPLSFRSSLFQSIFLSFIPSFLRLLYAYSDKGWVNKIRSPRSSILCLAISSWHLLYVTQIPYPGSLLQPKSSTK